MAKSQYVNEYNGCEYFTFADGETSKETKKLLPETDDLKGGADNG